MATLQYLEGSPHCLEILSDHKNLEVFRHTSKLSYRQAHWAEFLSHFSFTIHHISGKKAGKLDALSHRPDHILDHEDNEDRILLSPSLFAKPQQVTFTFDNSPLLQCIKDCQALDTEVVNVLRYLLASKSLPTKKLLSPNWTVQDGLTFYKGRLYIPADLDIHQSIIHSLHDTPSVSHPGHLKTWDLVKCQFYWPGIRCFTFDYIDSCAVCQATKNLPN